jgi:hypothetical protein
MKMWDMDESFLGGFAPQSFVMKLLYRRKDKRKSPNAPFRSRLSCYQYVIRVGEISRDQSRAFSRPFKVPSGSSRGHRGAAKKIAEKAKEDTKPG